jgi:general secretion pathway protein E
MIDRQGIARARTAADAADKRLDQALVELGLVAQSTLDQLLETLFGVGVVDLAEVPSEALVPDKLAPAYLATVAAIPWSLEAGLLTLAMVDPFDDFTARAISLKLGVSVVRQRIDRGEFRQAFGRLYADSWLAASLAPVDEDENRETDLADVEVLRDAASDAPVVRFVQEMIRRAVEQGASDIHLRSAASGAEMHYRILGRLVAQDPPDAHLISGIVSRLKVLANLDISERRLPQDGRIRTNVGGRPIDVRVSTMPHVRGEGAVLRLLTGEIAVSSLGELGFTPAIEQGLQRLFAVSEGLILVTGPTGSGKTTTLHAGLHQLIRPELNVVTVEDPVEYRLEGAAQIQVDEKIGLTFAKVLRSLLRQDPDVVLVGEIRDAETARIAVQAALTGHLVLATLHTNSALAAVPRLIDMGVEPYLLPAVLRGVLSQRLVRRLCPGRSAADDPAHSAGCPVCKGTGYVGRAAVGELATLDAEVTAALCANADLSPPLKQRLRSGGYRTLREDAQDRVARREIDAIEVEGLAYD